MFNKKVIILLTACIVVFGGIGTVMGYSLASNNQQLQPGIPLSLERSQSIVLASSADLNNDGVDELIVVYGKPFKPNSPFVQKMNVAVMDGKTQDVKTSNLQNFSGYDPTLSYADFTGDGLLEVMLQAGTGGTGGIVTTAILDFFAPEVKNLWSAKDDEGLPVTGQFIDGFKVRLDPFDGAPEAIINVAHYKDFYVQQGLYNEEGQLLQPGTSIMTYPYGMLTTLPGENRAMLRGIQDLKGITNLDTVSTLFSTLIYQDGAWQVDQLEYTTIWK